MRIRTTREQQGITITIETTAEAPFLDHLCAAFRARFDPPCDYGATPNTLAPAISNEEFLAKIAAALFAYVEPFPPKSPAA